MDFFLGEKTMKDVAYVSRKITEFTVIPLGELFCIVLRGNNYDAHDS